MKKLIIIASFLFLFPNLIFAKTLNLKEAIKIAYRENPDLRNEDISYKIKVLEHEINRTAFFPTLDLTNIGDVQYDNNFIPLDHSRPLKLSLNLVFFNGFRDVNEYQKSGLEVEREKLKSRLSKTKIKQEVTEQYFNVLKFQKKIELFTALRATLEKQRERLEYLYSKNKLVAKTEVLRIEANIAQNNIHILENFHQLEKSRRELAHLLNINDQDLILEDVIIPTRKIDSFSLNEDLKSAMSNGDKIRISDIEIEKGIKDIDIARSAYFPVVGIGLTKDFTEARHHHDSYNVALWFKWNLFRWGADIKKVSIAKYKLQLLELQQEDEKTEYTSKITGAYEDLETLSLELISQKYEREIRKENLRIATLKYERNLLGTSEYLETVAQFSDADVLYYSMQKDYLLLEEKYNDLIQ